MRLDGKVCIITGAGSGQGRAAALRFAEEGASVVVAEIDAVAGSSAADEIGAAGGEAIAVETDVSVEADWQHVVAVAEKQFGGVDVLYNNAAVAPAADGSVVDVPLEVWDRILAVNLTGPMLGCRHAIPQMLRRGGGSIINTSSIRAFVGGSQPIDAYTASKGALVSLTRSLAVVYGPQGIRANVIAPGTIRTPWPWCTTPTATREVGCGWPATRSAASVNPKRSPTWRSTWRRTSRAGPTAR